MKKLVTVTITIIATMAVMACGAQSQPGRQGFTKPMGDAVDTATKMGVDVDTANSYTYGTGEVTTSAALSGMGINLAGLVDQGDTDGRELDYFNAFYSIPVDTTKPAAFIVLLGFTDLSELFQLTFTSTNKPVFNTSTGALNMQVTDGSPLNITTTPGATAGVVGALIKDINRSVPFANGQTPFMFISGPTATTSTVKR